MKEELLEAIYGTVERLEQKVDELSASTKNAGAENVPANNDITKLDKSINAMFIKEEEVRGKNVKLHAILKQMFEDTGCFPGRDAFIGNPHGPGCPAG